MKVVIDRFEGSYAVCERDDKTMIDIKRDYLPSEAKEGDVLLVIEGRITIDKEETAKRKSEIDKLVEDFWL